MPSIEKEISIGKDMEFEKLPPYISLPKVHFVQILILLLAFVCAQKVFPKLPVYILNFFHVPYMWGMIYLLHS